MIASPAVTGCAAIAGEQDAPIIFSVKPNAAGQFQYHNSLTVDLGPVSVSNAALIGVTFETIEPPNTPDLTFLTSVLGQGVAPDGAVQPFVIGGPFPAGKAQGDGTVVFTGNVVPFFDDTTTLHVLWNGTVNTAYPSFPPDGFKVSATLQVDPQ